MYSFRHRHFSCAFVFTAPEILFVIFLTYRFFVFGALVSTLGPRHYSTNLWYPTSKEKIKRTVVNILLITSKNLLTKSFQTSVGKWTGQKITLLKYKMLRNELAWEGIFKLNRTKLIFVLTRTGNKLTKFVLTRNNFQEKA